jgi:hypothetical protein
MDPKEEEEIQKANFNHETLFKALEGIHKSLPDIEPAPYYACMLEFVKIFNIIGSAMAIAFKGMYFFSYNIEISLPRSPQSEKTTKTLQMG